MSIGKSGRVVVEIDPELKKRLYSELMANGISLKDWFIASATSYITPPSKRVDPEAEVVENE